MAHKIKVGDIHKQNGATPPEPTHFYHPWMKRIYRASLKPHLDYVLKNFPKVYVPKRTSR